MRGALLAATIGALVGCTGGCTGTMETFFAGDVVDIEHEIPYVAGTDNPRQHLDLYLPRDLRGEPVVVFVHGGFWIHQDKSFFQPVTGLYGNVGIALARRGIATAVIDYRLVPDVTFDEQFADVARAIAWVQAHIAEYGGDPDRVVIAGHSAGGHITALAAFDDARLAEAGGVDVSRIRGYAPLSPILDLDALAAAPPATNAEIVTEVFGADLAPYSPRTFFKADTAPVLVLLGGFDLKALRAQVPPAIDELTALGNPVRYALLPGDSHDDVVLDIDTDADQVTPLLASFVNDVTGSPP